MRPSVRRFAFVLLTLVCAAPEARAQYQRVPTVDDVLDMVQVAGVQISPDGRRLLYTRSDLKVWKDNKRVSSVWIADVDGSHAFQFLGSDKDRDPKWSPDGTQIAFLSTRDEKAGDQEAGAQIWMIRAGGGEAWKLTDHKGGIRSFAWAHDGSELVFTAADAVSETEHAAEKAGDDAIFVDEGPNGQEREHYVNLWRVTLADHAEHPITRERMFIGGFDPSPDAQRIACVYRTDATRNGQYHAEVAVIDAATGHKRDLTKNDAPESDVQWSPDGKWISFQAPSAVDWDLAENKLWLIPADGGTAREVSGQYTGTIARTVWGADARHMLFGGMRNGRGGIFEIDTTSGDVRAIATGDRVVGLDSATPDLRLAAGILSSPSAPPDVAVTTVGEGKTSTVTHLNPEVASLQLAQCRPITWNSRDGRAIEGLLWLPAGYKTGTRLPLLLSIHGGPAGVWSMAFRGIDHVYAGLGWAVLEPNVRGSSTYGDPLLRGNMKDIGGGDYEDLMTGVDAVIAQGIANPNELALRGWSYGGILGGWTLTQTKRFKAASLGAMVTDWSSEYAMGFNHDVRLWYIGGTPWDDADAYRRQSSYTHVAQVSTPTILFHGERDTTDTIGQSMMFYQALKDRSVPVRFIRFPREPHGFREPHHQRIRDTEEIAWLMKYTRGVAWTAPPRPDRATKTAITGAPSH
ncbi:MAG TPA: S9 family peptidase [Vicinamibacterales bacterium]|nr:S9 family peptidase [Vicinamibacterales bacterium]